MHAQPTPIRTLAACRKAVLPATLAVLMGAPALAPAAWNWGLAGPKIYWAEVIKGEQAAPEPATAAATMPQAADALYIHGDDLNICKTSVFPFVGWSILVSTIDVNNPPAELVATCENDNTIKAVCPTDTSTSSISGADSTNGICADVSNGFNNSQDSYGQFNDGQYIIDIAPKQQARDRSGTPYWVRGTSLGNMPVHVDSYWEWLDALQTQVEGLETRVTALEENPSGGGCGTTLVTLSNGTGTTSDLDDEDNEYFSLVRPSDPDRDPDHNTAGVGCPGVLSNFRVQVDDSPNVVIDTDDNYKFTLYRNGLATFIGCTISGNNTSCTDTSGTTNIALDKGDVINIQSDPYSYPDKSKATVQADYTPSGGIPAPIF
jgi:hypothetical protein